ncbi:MAG: hypothetical protein EA342_18670 [Leptolyngbya sp. LCM1.Bin17]|nr:MAG: hypothetical protein EA342_18670 [Leptolyngbya sp. LCM1.Bin17]
MLSLLSYLFRFSQALIRPDSARPSTMGLKVNSLSSKGAPAMKLSFLGQPYTVSTAVADVFPTGGMAVFMGQRYVRKQFTVTR